MTDQQFLNKYFKIYSDKTIQNYVGADALLS